eukprot:GHVR01098928.1.p1 GENE.GHVR01098928.1~~GHVR01098928.1.p1  ORF type:complete len:179 (+),score=8.93 GHVR01098928.1:40-537(+)
MGHHMSPISRELLLDAYSLEKSSYPEDEAANLEGITYRFDNSRDYFHQLTDSTGKLIGFINGTLCKGRELEHNSMSNHDPLGRTLCIHSVVVTSEFRRKGIGLNMLKNYIKTCEITGSVDLMLLLCHDHLISFYKAAGFKLIGPSKVQHGSILWYDMSLELPTNR